MTQGPIGGTTGKILWVDLSTASLREERLPREVYERYLGGMGLAAGVVLAFVQWTALRTASGVRRAGLWLPANSLAWCLGMPVVFLGMGSIPAGASVAQAVPVVVAATAAAGAVVGAVHGAVLVRVLLKQA